MELAEALRLKGKNSLELPAPCLALVGAGGKTSALFQLARELLGNPYPTVLLTTTTHLGSHQAACADWHLVLKNPDTLDALKEALPPGVGLLTGLPSPEGRLTCPTPDFLEELNTIAEDHHVPLLIEADGARLHPLKAPARYEPAVPQFADTILVCAGLSALGQSLEAEWVHRPELFSELINLPIGGKITPEKVANLLNNPLGGLKGLPPSARKILLLNQVTTPEILQAAEWIAEKSLQSYESVLSADLPLCEAFREGITSPSKQQICVYESVTAVILAAGEARRFGQAKQLLDWKGESMIRRVAKIALEAGCQPVLVVVGAYADEVRQALDGLPVRIIENNDWKAGLASSVKTALQVVPQTAGAALFMLADQPQVTIELVKKLIALHRLRFTPLTAPRHAGRRANPVLFDRVTFPALSRLEGETGGRALFGDERRYPVSWLDWDDPWLLFDIDTPEDYRRLKELYP